MPASFEPHHGPGAPRFGTPSGRMDPAGSLRTLAGFVIAALLHHLLIFHPFVADRLLDDHGPAPIYDAIPSVETTDDNDTVYLHDRRGLTVLLSMPACGASGDTAIPLLLNAPAEHPPKS